MFRQLSQNMTNDLLLDCLHFHACLPELFWFFHMKVNNLCKSMYNFFVMLSRSHECERSERIYISQYFFNHLEVKHLRDKKFCNNWKEYLKQNQIIFNFMNSNMKINHVFQQRFIYIPPLNALKLA